MQNRRKCSRNDLWNTQNIKLIRYKDDNNVINASIFGILKNISARGMFVLTDKPFKKDEKIWFYSKFNYNSSIGPKLNGKGFVVRQQKNGIAIVFLDMNLDQLQKCIFWMIDHS